MILAEFKRFIEGSDSCTQQLYDSFGHLNQTDLLVIITDEKVSLLRCTGTTLNVLENLNCSGSYHSRYCCLNI